ncbi:MAG TPA: HIT domain-containing protein [Kofleriaceae bacterium]
MSDCSFCKIVARTAPGLIIYEDASTISFLVKAPSVPGHTAVVPKLHYADIYSIPDDTLASLIASCKQHALRWRERIGSTGVNILNASGIDAEQSVFHFHFHLLPRFANDGYRTWPALHGVGQTREQMHATFRLDRE